MSVVPVLYGLGLAPLLTMVCRNAVAGTVFAVAIPGIMFVAGLVQALAGCDLSR